MNQRDKLTALIQRLGKGEPFNPVDVDDAVYWLRVLRDEAQAALPAKDAVLAAAEQVREAWFAISGAETGIEYELGLLDTALDNLGKPKRAALSAGSQKAEAG